MAWISTVSVYTDSAACDMSTGVQPGGGGG